MSDREQTPLSRQRRAWKMMQTAFDTRVSELERGLEAVRNVQAVIVKTTGARKVTCVKSEKLNVGNTPSESPSKGAKGGTQRCLPLPSSTSEDDNAGQVGAAPFGDDACATMVSANLPNEPFSSNILKSQRAVQVLRARWAHEANKPRTIGSIIRAPLAWSPVS